jgi:hypothetical protein
MLRTPLTQKRRDRPYFITSMTQPISIVLLVKGAATDAFFYCCQNIGSFFLCSVSVALDLKYFNAIIADISNNHKDMRRNKTSAY